MRIVCFAKAENNLEALIEQAVDDANVTLITRSDAPNAVLMSQDHYERLIEAIQVLHSPPIVAHP